MIVSDIMTTKLVTVGPDESLSHAANLLRQYHIHQLPVVRHVRVEDAEDPTLGGGRSRLVLHGLITSQDIDLAVALARQGSSSDVLQQPWQEQRVVDRMHRATIRVTPTTNVAAAAQLLVERGLDCLPVVEVGDGGEERETQTVLVGLLTRSDLLLALARSLGAFEPGMQLELPLPLGNLTPLAQTLLLAEELHVQVRSVLAAPLEGNVPRFATLRLGTIHPTPLLLRLQEANIQYTFADAFSEGDVHVT